LPDPFGDELHFELKNDRRSIKPVPASADLSRVFSHGESAVMSMMNDLSGTW